MNPDGQLVFDPGWLTATGSLDVSQLAPGFGDVAVWAMLVMDTAIRPRLRLSSEDAGGKSSSALRAEGELYRVPAGTIGPGHNEYSHRGTIRVAGTIERPLWARYATKGEQPKLELWLGEAAR